MLTDLLLRLSERPTASLPCRALARADRDAVERLIVSGLLEEMDRAPDWPVCEGCACGLDRRPLRPDGGRTIAACPLDHAADVEIEEADLRVFRIDEARLIRALTSGRGVPLANAPGVWRVASSEPGAAAFVTLRRAATESAALAAVLAQEAGGSRPIVLVAPTPRATALHALQQAKITLLSIRDVAGALPDGTPVLDLAALRRLPPVGAVSLLLRVDAKAIEVRGQRQPIGPQCFVALLVLARQATDAGGPVDKRRIGDATDREPRDIVRDLRKALSRDRPDAGEVRGWIVSFGRSGRYELRLPAAEIAILP